MSVPYLELASSPPAKAMGMLMAEGSGYRCLSQVRTGYNMHGVTHSDLVGLSPKSPVACLCSGHTAWPPGLSFHLRNKTRIGKHLLQECVRSQCLPLWKAQHLAQITEQDRASVWWAEAWLEFPQELANSVVGCGHHGKLLT